MLRAQPLHADIRSALEINIIMSALCANCTALRAHGALHKHAMVAWRLQSTLTLINWWSARRLSAGEPKRK